MFLVYLALGTDSVLYTRRGRSVLRLTFLILAVLQLAFLAVIFDQSILIWAMGLALFVKLVNTITIALILREDYAELRTKTDNFEREKERLEEKLRQRTEFEEAGKIGAMVEHELRTPLGFLLNKIGELKEEYKEDTTLVVKLEELDKLRKRLLGATRLVNLIRSSQALLEADMDIIHIANLLKRTVANVKELMPLQHVYINLKEVKHQLLVEGNKAWLEQAFENLLKNSFESIEQAGHSGKIQIDITLNQDGFVQITINDNGVGFPEEDIDKLTIPGFSINKKDRGNSGIGLFVADKVFKIHKGRMTLANKDGATVTVLIPRYISRKKKNYAPYTDE